MSIDSDKVPAGGRTHGRISVQTTDAHVPLAITPVSVTKLARLNLYPSRAYLVGARPVGVRVTDDTGAPVKVSASEHSHFEIDVTAVGRVAITHIGPPAAACQATITLSDSNGNKATLPVRWIGGGGSDGG